MTFRSSSSGQGPREASTKAEGARPGPRKPGRQRAGLRRGIHGDHLDPAQLRTPRPQPQGTQKICVSRLLSRLTHGLHLTSTGHLPASPGLVRYYLSRCVPQPGQKLQAGDGLRAAWLLSACSGAPLPGGCGSVGVARTLRTWLTVSVSCSVRSDSFQLHGLKPQLLYPWNSPGNNIGSG